VKFSVLGVVAPSRQVSVYVLHGPGAQLVSMPLGDKVL
jgi:hypothetical protein